MIDWAAFTPLAAVSGGALIGLSAGLFYLVCGRIAGISGVFAGVLHGEGGQRIWFLAGLLLAPAIWTLNTGDPFAAQRQMSLDWPALLLGGLAVGIGTRLAAGCTSGHGVCGLSNLSWRSLVAVLVFMGSGFLTVFLLRHLLGAGQ